MRHELVLLAGKIDRGVHRRQDCAAVQRRWPAWNCDTVCDRTFFSKHIYGLSDEGVCERWVYDPYFQHFTGEEFFQHEFPHERSDLSHWRKRLGGKLELLLAESLRVAHESGALRTRDLARVTVDTTVQPKDIIFPTDAKLLHAAIKGLTRLARKRGVRLRQSYVRIAKRAAMMAGRYAHAKQFNRDSPDESQTGINVRVFPALLQDRCEVLTATSTSDSAGEIATREIEAQHVERSK